MAVITDPEAIKVSNAVTRPLSQLLRRLYYESLAVKNTYGDQINRLFPAGEGIIQDGREDRGDTRLNADDTRKILLFANTFITAYEAEGVQAMTKPCVQELSVQ